MANYFLYAETAFIHQGDKAYLEALIKKVAGSGATGIKFQVLTDVNDFVSSCHKNYDALASYCFSLQEWEEMFRLAVNLGLEIVLMPLNAKALKLAQEFPVKYIEIHPVSYHDNSLRKAVKVTRCDIILSTGGRTIEEIKRDLSYYEDQAKVLLVGFQAFPSKLEEVRLHQIAYYHQKYPSLQIGYADHSAFDHEHAITSLEYAYLLGARVFEKHVALTAGEERVDFSAAVGTEALDEIATKLNFIERYINPGSSIIKAMTPAEELYRQRQLICVASHDIPKGHVVTTEDVVLKMYHDPIDTYADVSLVVGKKVDESISKDEPFFKKTLLIND